MALINPLTPTPAADTRPLPGTSSKAFGGAGAWINGRWHPNGAAAAKAGTEPPVEKVTPAYPGMLEDIATKSDKDPTSVAQAEAAKKQLVEAEQKTIEAADKAKAIAELHEKVRTEAAAGAKKAEADAKAEAAKAPPPITGTMRTVEKPDVVKAK